MTSFAFPMRFDWPVDCSCSMDSALRIIRKFAICGLLSYSVLLNCCIGKLNTSKLSISLHTEEKFSIVVAEFTFYFGESRSKGFATLRNVSKLQCFAKIGHAKSVGFQIYSAIWRSESRISSRYLEITSISLIYSLTFSRKKELLFWLPRGLNRLTCVTRQIRGDTQLRD